MADGLQERSLAGMVWCITPPINILTEGSVMVRIFNLNRKARLHTNAICNCEKRDKETSPQCRGTVVIKASVSFELRVYTI